MLFPRIPIEELKKGETFLDSDGNRWTVIGKLENARAVNVESSEAADDADGGVYADSLEYGELVKIDQMWGSLIAGRCKPCRIVYVWARRHRVKLREALCTDCGRGLTQTAPRLLDPHGREARFECPKSRPAKPKPPKDDGPPALKRLLKF